MTLTRLRELRTLQQQVGERRAQQWVNDPVRWVQDCVKFDEGEGLTGYQEAELAALAEHRKVSVRGPRGSGKTMPAALVFWWFVCTRELLGVDWKIPSTAGSWDQVRLYLWPEIHKWYRRIDWDTVGIAKPQKGRDLLTYHLKLAHGEGFGKATDDPELIEGAHASHMLVIIDEGKSVVDGIWDAVEGFFASPGVYYAFALSTPGAPVGRFHDIHTRRPGLQDWYPIKVSIEEAIEGGRVTEQWRSDREKQWGPESQLYRCHVLAEFAGEEDGTIPLAWVEAAIDRWKLPEKPVCRRLGVDVADTGSNLTVIAFRDGDCLYRIDTFTDGDVLDHAERVKTRAQRGTQVVIDSIGVGAGTAAALKRVQTLTTLPFVASKGTKRRDKSGEMRFTNLRSAAWWNLRELLAPPSMIQLPNDPLLIGDLTAPRWREMAGGKIQIESKDDISKRLGRSTDVGDAIVQSFWEDVAGERLGTSMVAV